MSADRLGKVEVRLTPKQRRFAEEYLVDLCGAKAAVRAGYSPRTADRIASRLLRHPAIAAIHAEHAERTGAELNLTVKRLEEELARVAFVDPRSVFDEQGRLLPINEMPENARRALASVEVEELFEGRGEERARVGTLRRVKFWSKPEALRLGFQRLGALVDRHEVEVKQPDHDLSDAEWEAMALLTHRVRAPQPDAAPDEAKR